MQIIKRKNLAKISALIVLPHKICFLMKGINLNFLSKFYSEHCLKIVRPKLNEI